MLPRITQIKLTCAHQLQQVIVFRIYCSVIFFFLNTHQSKLLFHTLGTSFSFTFDNYLTLSPSRQISRQKCEAYTALFRVVDICTRFGILHTDRYFAHVTRMSTSIFIINESVQQIVPLTNPAALEKYALWSQNYLDLTPSPRQHVGCITNLEQSIY